MRDFKRKPSFRRRDDDRGSPSFESRGKRTFGDRGSGGSRGFDRNKRFGDRGSGGFKREHLRMHDVTCDKCGKECQVPFKPTTDKPVYCSDCFRRNERTDTREERRPEERRERSDKSPDRLDQINAKLDKILRMLGSD